MPYKEKLLNMSFLTQTEPYSNLNITSLKLFNIAEHIANPRRVKTVDLWTVWRYFGAKRFPNSHVNVLYDIPLPHNKYVEKKWENFLTLP